MSAPGAVTVCGRVLTLKRDLGEIGIYEVPGITVQLWRDRFGQWGAFAIYGGVEYRSSTHETHFAALAEASQALLPRGN